MRLSRFWLFLKIAFLVKNNSYWIGWCVGEWAVASFHWSQISCWGRRIKCREHYIVVIKMKGAIGQPGNVGTPSMNGTGDTDHFISLFEILGMSYFLEHIYKHCVWKIWWSRDYFHRGHTKQNSTYSLKIQLSSNLKTSLLLTKSVFSGSSGDKESACKAGNLDLIPVLGRYPGGGNGNPLQYCCLENPMDRGACQATSMELQKVGHGD